MKTILHLPTLEQANQMMSEAGQSNPGPWIQHSQYVAQAAESIAARHPRLDPASARVMGLLHDIGRRVGPTDMRHVLDGYTYLAQQGFADAARICLTHSFPIQNAFAGAGKWDCSAEELAFVQDYLARAEYDEYDALLQLCDSIALPGGFCLMEKRLVDVALRHGFNDFTLEKWKAFLRIQKEFEAAIGGSIYALLPDVVSSTFGSELNGRAGPVSSPNKP